MFLSEPEWQAVLLSLKVSSLAVALSLPFGIFFSWLLVRRTFPGKALLDSILHLPLVLPPVVVGVPAAGGHGAARVYWQLAV
ncbi:Molybdenum transport system permease ModB [Klebsiella pneumoniae]|nr:Molybdenum transport system permease ModB [Klebsiella pneumoniae]